MASSVENNRSSNVLHPPVHIRSLSQSLSAPPDAEYGQRKRVIVVVVVVFGVVLFITAIFVCIRSIRRNKKREREFYSETSAMIEAGEMSPRFSPMALGLKIRSYGYQEIVKATDEFSDSNFLGEGGFGKVHKGTMPNGNSIAVKCLSTGSSQGDKEFRAEIETLSNIRHEHLVPLIGYCMAQGQRILVYPFIPNSTLQYHLHQNKEVTLDWEKRLQIAIGIAKGLVHLHEECHPRVIHRDIKSANILLDGNYHAKVTDFGLAKLKPVTEGPSLPLTTRVIGTFGYMSPEYESGGRINEKADVYSYGVVVLELITGRQASDPNQPDYKLSDWARPIMEQALQDGRFDTIVDQKLGRQYDRLKMTNLLACAAACIRKPANLRPKLSKVVGVLEDTESMALLDDALTEHVTRQPSYHLS